jgi:hypothetical protein
MHKHCAKREAACMCVINPKWMVVGNMYSHAQYDVIQPTINSEERRYTGINWEQSDMDTRSCLGKEQRAVISA